MKSEREKRKKTDREKRKSSWVSQSRNFTRKIIIIPDSWIQWSDQLVDDHNLVGGRNGAEMERRNWKEETARKKEGMRKRERRNEEEKSHRYLDMREEKSGNENVSVIGRWFDGLKKVIQHSFQQIEDKQIQGKRRKKRKKKQERERKKKKEMEWKIFTNLHSWFSFR